ncbi:ABC transporter permease [Corynebacterium aquilae]|uniref:ABC transporter permease n=1 Tax=Corynebacterium aquilae DSM 44791 TaxID=1431546 RepID=A0A1L7CGU9_9CORY|nr:ABC transporter permease [Corynebacterium aquilae DSM 44791]
MIGLIVLVALTTYAIVVPIVAHIDPAMTDFANRGLSPSAEHLFGTDSKGRDVFVRLAAGLRISLLIALLTAIISTVVGTTIGVVSALLGGVVDQVLMRVTDTVNALPHLLLGLLIVSMFPGNIVAIVASLVLTHWVSTARTVRAQVLSVRTASFVSLSYLQGASTQQVLWRHFVPAAMGQALVGLVLLIPHAVWHESTLSFLGVGLPPHHPSLGTILSDAEGALLLGHWWILVIPATLLIATTLSIGAVGKGLAAAAHGVGGESRV